MNAARHRYLVTSAVAAALSVLMLALAGCAHLPGGTPVQDPEPILAGFAATLRTQLNDLSADLPHQETKTDNGDELISCDDFGGWPHQWQYGINIQMGETDARPYARPIVDRLEGEGWDIRDITWGSLDQVKFIAQRDGYVLTINGTVRGGFGILGSSPCVDEDGTVDRSEVP